MILLKDNSIQTLDGYSPKQIEVFKEYSHKSLNRLEENNPNLLIFSPKLNYKNFYNEPLWQIRDNKIMTNNLMGFIGFSECSVRITSRFTEYNNQNPKDFFLHYMLQKTFLGQVVNLEIGTTEQEDIWEYYYYLFPHYLQKALCLGLYKEYIYKKYNNINVRGSIDIKRHIQKNIPFQGEISYNTREHSYNNRITQLVRHTIEYILQLSFGSTLLNGNLNIRENVDQIIHLTPDYHYNNRQTIIRDCREAIGNPYWQEYETLRKLCLKILNKESLSFQESEDKVHGILFDGAWLWEEYLATILPKEEFIHPDNHTWENPIYLAKHNVLRRYPDFYSQDNHIVLDAKYKKHPEDGGIEDRREDTHQIITYMHRLKSQKGILVYPSSKTNIDKKIYDLEGFGGYIIHEAHKITQENETYETFCQEMGKNEKHLLESLGYSYPSIKTDR